MWHVSRKLKFFMSLPGKLQLSGFQITILDINEKYIPYPNVSKKKHCSPSEKGRIFQVVSHNILKINILMKIKFTQNSNKNLILMRMKMAMLSLNFLINWIAIYIIPRFIIFLPLSQCLVSLKCIQNCCEKDNDINKAGLI